MAQFKLKPSESEEQPFYFTLVAKGNGATLMTSETYTTKDAAINGMKAVVEALNVKPIQYNDLTE